MEEIVYKNPQHFLKYIKSKPEDYWIKRGDKQALKIFHLMSKRVPAYKDFLKKNNINPEKIKTIQDFRLLPLLNKDNYLKYYDREWLSWDGNLLDKPLTIAATSGSTGEPFYFPRSKFQEEKFALTADMCFRDFFDTKGKKTLFVDAFALGIWIGGMFMYQALKYVSDKGDMHISIATPGANKVETINVIKHMADHFDQIIIGGYAPLVKDLIDLGIQSEFDWNKYNIKYFFAAEGFTEGFRNYLLEKGGLKNIYVGSVNHYGTADLGTMSHETPFTILLRRLAQQDSLFFEKVFGDTHKMPTLTQFIPELFYFEEINDTLACTSLASFPVVRYNLKDNGHVKTLSQVFDDARAVEYNLDEEISRHNLSEKMWNLPLVSVYERNDFTVNIYSVNIYPESIRKALEDKQIAHYVSGKFTMRVDYDEDSNQYLEIHVEMMSGKSDNDALKEKIVQHIVGVLNRENSEWQDFYADESIRHKILPRIILWPYEHEEHFSGKGKHKWVK